MESLISGDLSLLAKIFVVAIFPFSALDKVINWKSALAQANSSFLPGGPLLLVLAMIVEITTPICILSGWYAGIAALVLAGYCAVTGLLYHNFWAYPKFWKAGEQGYPHIWDFFKNFAIVGACIFIIQGTDLVSEMKRVEQELSSTSLLIGETNQLGQREQDQPFQA
jgi:putative oxidoreductase